MIRCLAHQDDLINNASLYTAKLNGGTFLLDISTNKSHNLHPSIEYDKLKILLNYTYLF
jgi:hypothetical protein